MLFSSAAYVGSLCMSVSCLLGPVASSLCDRYGCRATTISGGITCVIGLLMTSQAPSIYCMYLTFSVIVGFGICCVYTASFVIVPRYFLKRRSLATGAITCGPAGGLLVMGPFLQFLLDTLQWRKAFIAMAGLAALICLFALIYDPLTAKEISDFGVVSNTKQPHAICAKKSSWTRNIFTNPVLLIWSACPAVAYLGLYVPQVLLVNICLFVLFFLFLFSCHGVFIDQFIFKTIFGGKSKISLNSHKPISKTYRSKSDV